MKKHLKLGRVHGKDVPIPRLLHQRPQPNPLLETQILRHGWKYVGIFLLAALPGERDQAPSALRQEKLSVDRCRALDLRLAVLHGLRGRCDAGGGLEKSIRVVEIEAHQPRIRPRGVILAHDEGIGGRRAVQGNEGEAKISSPGLRLPVVGPDLRKDVLVSVCTVFGAHLPNAVLDRVVHLVDVVQVEHS